MARRRTTQAHDEGHENAERWLLTYADMITLLMVLFIVLFAISQVDQKKFDMFSSGLAQSFGAARVLDGSSGVLQGSQSQSPVQNDTLEAQRALEQQRLAAMQASRAAEDMRKIRDKIAAALAAKGLSSAVQFEITERGLVVNVVTDRVLFDVGSADLRVDGNRVLDAIAPALVGLPNRMSVEGHTDNAPISGGRYPSNWELSTERATTVLRYLLARHVTPQTISAAGYADQRPIASNATPTGRARNRRVAIIILSNLPATPTAPVVPDATPDQVPGV